jgi:hypothetical protein
MGFDQHSMIANPEEQIFVDHLNYDFHLLSNAQAVNAGTNLVLPTVFEDLDNVSRPQGNGFDIGAYEFNTLTTVEEDLSLQDFILFQNYPNPFNPATTIRYTIPFVIASVAKQSQLVTLKVYDVLGNEIITLVNEEKPAGTFEVIWYTENLPSGVYFYRLSAGEFNLTKSMLLIK